MSRTGNDKESSIADKLHDIPALEAVLQRVTRDAIRQHALIGNPIAFWRDDKLVIEIPKLEDFAPEDATP